MPFVAKEPRQGRSGRTRLEVSRSASSRQQKTSVANPERSRLYSTFIPAYDAVWPLFVRRRLRRSIQELGICPGSLVLEVGIGTGLSMPAYPQSAQVIGIDLSSEMLCQAKQKIRREGWQHISVQEMNAESLKFADQAFDFVTAFHVVSVVSDPRSMMLEIARVLKPGGKALVINHFRSEIPWVAKVVDRADPLTRHLGWRTNINHEDVFADLPFELRVKSSPLSLFTILQATKKYI